MRSLVPASLLLLSSLAACAAPVTSSDTGAARETARPTVAVTPASTPQPTVAPSQPGPTAAAVMSGDVAVTMTDAMRFEPAALTARAGVPVTFVVENDGAIVHEFFVGTPAEQAEHAIEMAAGGAAHGHGNGISVDPGQTDWITLTFAQAGSLEV